MLNTPSVRSKLNNVSDLYNEFQLNVLIPTETWHENADSVTIKRLHGMGLNVIEAAGLYRRVPI